MKTLKTLALTLMLAFCTVLANASPASNNSIDKIINAYLEVKNALVGGDGNVVKTKAKDLLAALSAKPDANLSAAQQKILAKYQEKLVFDSRHMSETAEIDHQREHFANLSKNMYEVVKSVKMNTAPIYELYCPMKKAYWLSESEQIKNPYFGSKMLTCGKVTETLAPVK
jgi:thiamine biosynthesis lipoprotein ApbE